MSKARRWMCGVLIALAVLAPAAWFGLGAVATHRVDDDLANAIPEPVAAPVQVARTLETILAREIEHNNWQPNDPWFYANGLTDNGRNYQLGLLHGMRRALLEYATRTIRARADGAPSADLQTALNYLHYPPTVWELDVTQGLGASSTSQYRVALDALRAFERTGGDADAIGELRSDQLLRFVETLQNDITAHVLSLQETALKRPAMWDTAVDDLFYQTKGAGFVYAALAPALSGDFAKAMEQKRLHDLWGQLEVALARLATYKPTIVLTGAPDSVLLPNHLIVQGFYASRCAEILSRIEEALRS